MQDKLNQEEIKRYARHLILPEVGKSGQEKLKNSSVLLIGAGGLGSPLALYCAAAGIGKIGIVDFDVVDESNLQRQILHGTASIGKSKLESAKQRLKDLNPYVELILYPEALTSENAINIFKQYDVVADGTDNFPTRYLVNDACVITKKPNIYASIFRFEGQLSVFNEKDGPCYRCVYPEPPPAGLVPSCAEGGVLGVLPGVMGALQANEVIKVILGIGNTASGRLLMYDALKLKFRELKLKKDPHCPMCSKQPQITSLIDYKQFCGVVNNNEEEQPSISVHELKTIMESNQNIQIIDVREEHETQISKLDNTQLVPLTSLESKLDSFDKSIAYYVHCKSGGRSAKAVKLMRDKGFNASNVKGGILAWAKEIDPSMHTY